MKFSEIEREQWPELQPYLDTALIPLSGLTGLESPWQATQALERLRDALEPLETAFKGRIVTYPAVHYAEDDECLSRLVDGLCERLRETGFTYVVVVAGHPRLLELQFGSNCLLIGPYDENDTEEYWTRGKRSIEALWMGMQR